MLYFVLSNGQEITWHTGELIPITEPFSVIEIQADGHEWEHVKPLAAKLDIRPQKTDSYVVNYYGAAAKCITLAMLDEERRK